METRTGTIEVEGQAGPMPVFVAQPTAGGQFPGVILVMEAFGLNEHIKDVAQRIAAEGYFVAAPDLYYREAKRVVGYDELPEAIRLMNELSDENILKDVGAVIRALQVDPQVRVDRIGMTGFCMGGRITFLTACNNSAIKAAVPFYGGGIGTVWQPGERTPKAPLEYADKLQAPILLFFGGKDAFIPAAEVEKIRARLAELGKNAEVVVYEDADHGFFCDQRGSYNQAAASDAWQRLLKFFDQHLKH